MPAISFLKINAQQSPPFISSESMHWADSVLKTLSFDEKLGQLFMIETNADWPQHDVDSVAELITRFHIGGIIIFKGGPVAQATRINYYQSLSKIPLLVSIDGEWGLSMRIDSTIRFPRQMTLSAIKNDSLIYDMGAEIARQCKRIGIHINFAPDIDINNNPLNPVINTRSFGEDKYQVASKGLLYMNGMQSNHILACGKHFPGHGDTDADSHYNLPLITKTFAELDNLELYPFKQLIENGMGSIMIAHLNIPSIDTSANRPSSLSKYVVRDLLKNQMGFGGLVFTDALKMKGVANYYSPGLADAQALLAGNDILLMGENVEVAIEKIKELVDEKEISKKEIDEHVRKILMVKFWTGLNEFTPVKTENLVSDLNTEAALELNHKLYSNAITLLQNKDDLLPFRNIEPGKIASVAVNDTNNNPFQLMLNRYTKVDCYAIPKEEPQLFIDTLIAFLSKYETVIVSIHNTTTKASFNYGITEAMNYLIAGLKKKQKVIVCVYGNSYCLGKLKEAEKADGLIISFEDTWLPQYITAQMLFGGSYPSGSLPVTPSAAYRRGEGLTYKNYSPRLSYGSPLSLGISADALSDIDSIIENAIDSHAFPGCQLMAAKDGKIFYSRTFGMHSYNDSTNVKSTDLYDIASITKIASTALVVMKLYEEGKIDLTKTVADYLPDWRKSNKASLKIFELLTHQAGLQAWIPFWKQTANSSGKLSPKLYSKKHKGDFTVQVADSLFLNQYYIPKIWRQIMSSPVENRGTYLYSDIGMLIMQRIAERITGKTINQYVTENFYNPLGLHRLTFFPRNKFNISEIIPTESDTAFRKQLVHGYVHDPAAALLGGAAGNAGLFSDANSLCIIMQMLMNGGEYDGKRYLQKETVELFTQKYIPENRRGLIFDKPITDNPAASPAAKSASSKTFGHTGFTGTCAWADPENNLIFIFLSNRVHPSAAENKLAKMNVRTNVQEVFYEALKK